MVYQYLFAEGTLVALKDTYAPKHSDEIPIPNLEVLALMKSFVSKEYVTTIFNWRWNYYVLTNKGIEYLRAYLALPEEVTPATLKKAPLAPGAKPEGYEREREGARPYKPKSAPGSEFNPEFKREGGVGRGRDGYRSRKDA